MPNHNEIRNDHLEINRDLFIRPVQLAGGWPIPYLKIKNLKEILKDAPRLVLQGNFKEKIRINDMLNGGLKIPHLHINKEIVLLDKPLLKDYLHAVADEIDNIKDFSELQNHIR